MSKLIALILLLWWGAASAAPVTWYITDLVLNPGGSAPVTVTGSFVYDASYQQYSDVNIFTNNTTYQYLDPGWATYGNPQDWVYSTPTALFITDVDEDSLPQVCDTSFADPCEGSPLYYPDFTGQNAFYIDFAAPLSDAGGTIGISYALEGGCLEAWCANPASFENEAYSGTISSVVPVPAAVWLFGSGLGLLGWFRLRAQS